MLRMTNAASQQALEEGKKRLREFLEASDTGRQALTMSGQGDIPMRKMNSSGRETASTVDEDDDEI